MILTSRSLKYPLGNQDDLVLAGAVGSKRNDAAPIRTVLVSTQEAHDMTRTSNNALDKKKPPPTRVAKDTTHAQKTDRPEASEDGDYAVSKLSLHTSPNLPILADIQNQARRTGSFLSAYCKDRQTLLTERPVYQ